MKFAVGRETIAKYQRMRFLLAATAALSIAGTAQAAVVTLFSDDFSADTPALAITTSLTLHDPMPMHSMHTSEQ
jgi:hypothetical protein